MKFVLPDNKINIYILYYRIVVNEISVIVTSGKNRYLASTRKHRPNNVFSGENISAFLVSESKR
jgi:hypothetical protein